MRIQKSTVDVVALSELVRTGSERGCRGAFSRSPAKHQRWPRRRLGASFWAGAELSRPVTAGGIGRREYPMVLTLLRLGLRAADVAALALMASKCPAAQIVVVGRV
jgi:hypothetical protein